MKTRLTTLLAMLLCAWVATRAASPSHDIYKDYPAMLSHCTASLKASLEANPALHIDSIQARITDDITDAPLGPASRLRPASRKRLTPGQVYDKGMESSLVFGKMEYIGYAKADSAFSNASAVALTPDGLCATNYHVVADVVLRGALDHKVKGDKARFVMDSRGRTFPLESILYVDPTNDLAIIKVDTGAETLNPATIGGDLHQGDAVYCLSNTTGNYFHFTGGQVSNLTRKCDSRSGRTQYLLDITADYGVGASGGPIYDSCGNLVALVSSTLSIYANPQQGRNFQMAYKQTVPVFLISELFSGR